MSVGLDIGSRTIKVVQLSREGEKIDLISAGITPYAGKKVVELSDEREMSMLSRLIEKLFNEAKISERDVSIALPDSLVYTRSIKYPLLTDQEIASAVRWEAEQYVPFPVKDAIIEHVILERRENSNPPDVLVLLVAVPRKTVEKYIKVLEMAKINVVSVETELIALARSLGLKGRTVLVVDLGAYSTDLALVKDKMLYFSRSIATAGETLTRSLVQGLGLDYQQAEEYKKAYGLSGEKLEGRVRETLKPAFNLIAEEIKKAIYFYQTEYQSDPPKAIIISGGTASLPELISFIGQTTGLEVIMGNPFQGISVSQQAYKVLSSFAPYYAVAVGLALKEEE